MGAPFVRSILDAAYLGALSVWIGSLLFTSVGILPVLARIHDPVIRLAAILPLLNRLHVWCVTCGAIALPAFLGAPLAFPEYRGPWVGVRAGLILLATLLMIGYGHGILQDLRRLDPKSTDVPDRLATTLRRIRRTGIGTCLILSALLVDFAFRPPPTTAGISEPTPQERAERAFEEFARKQRLYEERRQELPDSPAADGGDPGDS